MKKMLNELVGLNDVNAKVLFFETGANGEMNHYTRKGKLKLPEIGEPTTLWY